MRNLSTIRAHITKGGLKGTGMPIRICKGGEAKKGKEGKRPATGSEKMTTQKWGRKEQICV